MGAMGAITTTSKKLWGRCPQVAPTGILPCHFSNSKMSQFLQSVWYNPSHNCTEPKCTVKIMNVSFASDKSSADFSLKMHQKRLATGRAYSVPRLLAGFKE